MLGHYEDNSQFTIPLWKHTSILSSFFPITLTFNPMQMPTTTPLVEKLSLEESNSMTLLQSYVIVIFFLD